MTMDVTIMRGAYDTPTIECPYCKTPCEADWVDVGVGMVQCGPYHCDICHASEIGPSDEPRKLTEQEDKCGWYAPGAEYGSSANVIGGKIVTAEQAKYAYRREFKNNPLWYDKEYVDNWWKQLREGQDKPL